MMTEGERAGFQDLLDLAEENIRTEWEQEFIDDMTRKALDPFWSPTERQWEKLEEIASGPPPF